MPNSNYSAAIKEAYVFAPEKIVYHTLELLHPAFVDESGNQTAIRVVADRSDLTAKLESTAPLNAGQNVTFIRMPFTAIASGINGETITPELKVQMDNVGREVLKNVEAANDSLTPIRLTYRLYVDGVPEAQHVAKFELSEVNVSLTTISATGIIVNTMAGKTFPNRVSTTKEFPSLTP